MPEFRNLAWDSEFFGFPVAAINNPALLPEAVAELLNTLKDQGVSLVYWPTVISTPERSSEWLIAQHGQLVDRKVTYEIALDTIDEQSLSGDTDLVTVVPDAAAPELTQLAIRAGRYSRFFVDSRISNRKAEQLYEQWIAKSLARTMADDVLACIEQEKYVGVVTLSVDGDVGRIGLLSVAAERIRQGIGRRLLRGALRWSANRHCNRVEVITQLANDAACGLYTSSGFRQKQIHPYFHFWPQLRD